MSLMSPAVAAVLARHDALLLVALEDMEPLPAGEGYEAVELVPGVTIGWEARKGSSACCDQCCFGKNDKLCAAAPSCCRSPEPDAVSWGFWKFV